MQSNIAISDPTAHVLVVCMCETMALLTAYMPLLSLKWKTLFCSQYLIFLFSQVEQTRANTLSALLTVYLLQETAFLSVSLSFSLSLFL